MSLGVGWQQAHGSPRAEGRPRAAQSCCCRSEQHTASSLDPGVGDGCRHGPLGGHHGHATVHAHAICGQRRKEAGWGGGQNGGRSFFSICQLRGAWFKHRCRSKTETYSAKGSPQPPASSPQPPAPGAQQAINTSANALASTRSSGAIFSKIFLLGLSCASGSLPYLQWQMAHGRQQCMLESL